jgi:hypothetical protein
LEAGLTEAFGVRATVRRFGGGGEIEVMVAGSFESAAWM